MSVPFVLKLFKNLFYMVAGMMSIVGSIGFAYYSKELCLLSDNMVLPLMYFLFGLVGLLFYFIILKVDGGIEI